MEDTKNKLRITWRKMDRCMLQVKLKKQSKGQKQKLQTYEHIT